MASWEKAVLTRAMDGGEMTVSRLHAHCLEECGKVLLPVFPRAQGLT